MAQSTSFEGDSIFNLLEETNGSLSKSDSLRKDNHSLLIMNASFQQFSGPPAGQRDSAPDFLVVRHRPPVSTVPNAYNVSPGLETKSVPVKKVTDFSHPGYP